MATPIKPDSNKLPSFLPALPHALKKAGDAVVQTLKNFGSHFGFVSAKPIPLKGNEPGLNPELLNLLKSGDFKTLDQTIRKQLGESYASFGESRLPTNKPSSPSQTKQPAPAAKAAASAPVKTAAPTSKSASLTSLFGLVQRGPVQTIRDGMTDLQRAAQRRSLTSQEKTTLNKLSEQCKEETIAEIKGSAEFQKLVKTPEAQKAWEENFRANFSLAPGSLSSGIDVMGSIEKATIASMSPEEQRELLIELRAERNLQGDKAFAEVLNSGKIGPSLKAGLATPSIIRGKFLYKLLFSLRLCVELVVATHRLNAKARRRKEKWLILLLFCQIEKGGVNF